MRSRLLESPRHVALLGVSVLVSLALTTGSAISADAHRAAANGRCRSLRVTGDTVTHARARARRSGCLLQLHGARLTDAGVQTIERQRPLRHAEVLAVWVNPMCWRSAAPGPPAGEPLITPGATGLTAGLYVAGGPLVPFSNPRCASPPGTPSPGTITVINAATGQIVATRTVAAGQLASFALAPGEYTIAGVFANASSNSNPFTGTVTSVAITAGHNTRQDIIAPVP